MRLSGHVIENLQIYGHPAMRYKNRFAMIRKFSMLTSTMLTSTKAKEMVNKYEVSYYLNFFGLE